MSPFFSVVLATYNRSRFIVPTIQSILNQTEQDFELLVVGDACDDDTGAVVSSFGLPRVVWRNLATRHGTQSGPNNEGIRLARGPWIAYIGHDDVWAPDHLSELRALITRDPSAKLAVSGCLFHGPPDSDVFYVTGMFEDSVEGRQHLFPPSSFAHCRDLAVRLGGWRGLRATALPVDRDFLWRAAQSGTRLASTGRVTVHKFAASHRYLSYLRPGATEQEALIGRLGTGDSWVSALVEKSRASGRFMSMRHRTIAEEAPGRRVERISVANGLSRPPLRPLADRVVIAQSEEPRALDWHPPAADTPRARWSGPNPRPRILLPFTGTLANVSIEVVGLAPGAWIKDVSVFVEQQQADTCLGRAGGGSLELRFTAPLSRQSYTVVSLHTPVMFYPVTADGTPHTRRAGIAVGDVVLTPA